MQASDEDRPKSCKPGLANLPIAMGKDIISVDRNGHPVLVQTVDKVETALCAMSVTVNRIIIWDCAHLSVKSYGLVARDGEYCQ